MAKKHHHQDGETVETVKIMGIECEVMPDERPRTVRQWLRAKGLDPQALYDDGSIVELCNIVAHRGWGVSCNEES